MSDDRLVLDEDRLEDRNKVHVSPTITGRLSRRLAGTTGRGRFLRLMGVGAVGAGVALARPKPSRGYHSWECSENSPHCCGNCKRGCPSGCSTCCTWDYCYNGCIYRCSYCTCWWSSHPYDWCHCWGRTDIPCEPYAGPCQCP